MIISNVYQTRFNQKTKIFKALAILFLLLAGTHVPGFSQTTGDLYFYNGFDQKEWFYRQPDVFAFSTVGGLAYAGSLNPAVVSGLEEKSSSSGKIFIIHFNGSASEIQKENEKALIRNSSQYSCEFDVITQSPSEPHSSNKWKVVDDIIVVVFSHRPSTTELSTFTGKYELALHRSPDPALPAFAHPIYQFKLRGSQKCMEGSRTMNVAARMYEEEPGLVRFADPNILEFFEPDGNPLYEQQWYFENTGQIIDGFLAGTPDADTDVDKVWDNGYTGSGIVVGVVDFHGYDLHHEDMINGTDSTFLPGWDAITDSPLLVGNHIGQPSAHGMNVSGIIGARNHDVDSIGMVGTAFNSHIIPVLIDGTAASINIALDHMLDRDPDVINMSWGSTSNVGSVSIRLQTLANNGRGTKGTVLVASAGNENGETGRWPAALPETIGVIASTPDDFRKKNLDDWEDATGSWGSNFGKWYDVAAPGVFQVSTDHSGIWGYNDLPGSDGNYLARFGGTSGAAPLVAGICALLLEADPNLYATPGTNVVKSILRSTAEKVHPGSYDYNAYPTEPGRSLQMGFGRVNAFNALGLVSRPEELGVKNNVPIVINPVTGQLELIGKGKDPFDGSIQLIDIEGRVLIEAVIRLSQNKAQIDIGDISPGIYFVQFLDSHRNLAGVSKVIVQ